MKLKPSMELKVTFQHSDTKKKSGREKCDLKIKQNEDSSHSFRDIIIIIKIIPTLFIQGLADANYHDVISDGASSRTIRNSELK